LGRNAIRRYNTYKEENTFTVGKTSGHAGEKRKRKLALHTRNKIFQRPKEIANRVRENE